MDKSISFWAFFLPITVFTKELGLLQIGGIEFDFISYPFFIIAFALFFFAQKIRVTPSEFLVFLLFLVHGLLNTEIFGLPKVLFFKQFLPIMLIYFVCKSIINKKNLLIIFDNYVVLSYWAAIIGLIQFILKFFGFLFLTPLHGFFIDSIALEPSHYIAIVLPAAVYLFEKKEYNYKLLIITLSIILTFKLTAVFSIVLYLLLSNIRRVKYLLLVSPFLIFVSFLIINYNSDFLDRVLGLKDFFSDGDLSQVNNLTAFSFTSNLEVALMNFKNSYGFGVGLGGHDTTYFNYFRTSWLNSIGLNAKSAHSLTVRVISELGIIGLCIYTFIYYKLLKIKNMEYKALALAAFSHFVVKSIKLGSYFDYGTLFFLSIIIIAIRVDSKKIYKYF